ncbi:MAG: hypothetical protein EOM21_15970 [Gammaproteobacteria bacterium]|nr:hypothetical protein [Gammaproteobacteria bacterium]
MTLQEIKQAVEDGQTVCWSTPNYRVLKDAIGQWLIHSQANGHYIGLTHRDGVTLNGEEDEFFVLGEKR